MAPADSATSVGGAPAASPATAVGAGDSYARSLEAALHARNVPAEAIRLPNFAAADPGQSGPVQPTYAQGPAPMGIADLGLRNVSGTLQPYNYSTPSVEGTINLTRAVAASADAGDPGTFGVQLDAVATNVTLWGIPGFEFWTQNVAVYTPENDSLTLLDNVWNFSAPNASLTGNAFASVGPTGVLVAPYYYYAIGPTLTISYPFTLTLYLNTTLTAGDPTVFFNYSVRNSSGIVASGAYDEVTFFAGASSSADAAPPIGFAVNGSAYDPIGLPNDIEFVLTGDGGGSTTTFYAMDGGMSLDRWVRGGYAEVPAAFDAGADTGETSDGVLPYYRTPSVPGSPSVVLALGPSYVLGLWNVSAALEGARAFQGTFRPQNAFLFINPGTSPNASTAQWVPTLHLGAAASDFVIPNGGSYTFQWLLSDRTPVNATEDPLANSTLNPLVLNLTAAAARGSYTPLLAWGNAELDAISSSGNGTAGNPYVLIHRPVGPLDPLFGETNELGYPVFAAVLLVNTTDYVDVDDPSVAIDYGSWLAPTLDRLGLPSSNDLQIALWNTSDVVVENSTDLGGWLPLDAEDFPVGELVLWGSSDDLVAGNTFLDQGVAIALVGGTNNTVWGNTILTGSLLPSFAYAVDPVGLLETESGDLLYNNYLDVDIPAVTPVYTPALCPFGCYVPYPVDVWNVSLEPASVTSIVLGVPLSGSILSTSYQGGNFWWNYGTSEDPFGVLPYDDGGFIVIGGDYYPLFYDPLYTVTFQENGLVPGPLWNVTVDGITNSSFVAIANLTLPNGSYAAAIGVPSGYEGPALVAFVVNGTNVTVPVNFSEEFVVTVKETGLVSGWTWNATLLGTTEGAGSLAFSSTNGSEAVELVNGTYDLTFQAYGYAPAGHVPTHLHVNGRAATVNVEFALVAILTVSAIGLASDAGWTVSVTQDGVTVQQSAIGDGEIVFTVLQLNPGAFTWTVSATNYSASPAQGSGDAPTPVAASVLFKSNSSSPSPLLDPWFLATVAAGVLAAVGFALFALERRRGRRPPPPLKSPPPVTPASAVPAGVVGASAPPAPAPAPTPAAPTPWSEGPADAEAPPTPVWQESPADADASSPPSRGA